MGSFIRNNGVGNGAYFSPGDTSYHDGFATNPGEELLLQAWELEKINLIRRGLAGHKPEEAIQRLLMFVKKFPTNTQMLKEIPG